VANAYDGTSLTFTYDPFTVVPSICPLTVTCEGVAGPSAAISCPTGPFTGAFTFTESYDQASYLGAVAPGDYVYTFKVSTGGADPLHNPTFTVTQTLLETCDPPSSITPSSPSPLNYVLGEAAATRNVAEFTVVPSYCEVDYTATKQDLASGDSPITIASNNRDFTVSYSTSLVPATNSETLTVTVTATSKTRWGAATGAITRDATFDVSFTNPCIDTTYVTITGPASLDNIEYTPETGAETYSAHAAFTTNIVSGASHSLCGDITVTGQFDGSDVTGDPLAYNAANRQFTADSTNIAFNDMTKTYGVTAMFTNWPQTVSNPSAPKATATGNISFKDACDTPSVFTASAAGSFTGGNGVGGASIYDGTASSF